MSELATQNLATYVYENLLLRIMTGILKKGDVLPSRKQLAEEYNVAEITIRTAVQMLALNSLVSTSQGKGTVVTFDMEHDDNSQFYWNFMSKRAPKTLSGLNSFTQIIRKPAAETLSFASAVFGRSFWKP